MITAPLSTDPYPWPYDGSVDGARLALVVAGAQAHWTTASVGAAETRQVLTAVAAAVRAAGGAVVVIRHGGVPSGRARPSPVPLPDAPAAAADDAFLAPFAPVVVPAAGCSGFAGSALDAVLTGLGADHLVLGGFGSEVTVDSTLRNANDRGYECLVLTDGCAPLDPWTGERALASVTMSGGIFGAIGPSSELLAALAPSDTPEVPA